MEIVTKYTAPTKYEKAPHGTIYKTITGDNKFEYYIQISIDPEHNEWERLGNLLERMFEKNIIPEDAVKTFMFL